MHYKKTSITAKVSFLLAIVFGLLMVLALCSCRCVKHTCVDQPAEDNLQLRVMSFNIRYGTANDGENRWENRCEMVFDVLHDNKPDVVGLQEALRFQIDQIRKALPEYGQVGVGRNDGKTKGEYTAILYLTERFSVDESATFWLSNTPAVPGSRHWGNSIPRICTWARMVEKKTGRAFYIYNTHLDHKSQPSRERSVVLLTSRINDRRYLEPCVVTGDFNAGENNPAILYLKGKIALSTEDKGKFSNPVPMLDTFRLLHPGAQEVGTFNRFGGRRNGEKIDFIFVPPGVRLLEAEIIRTERNGRYPSDHFPVSARFSLPATAKPGRINAGRREGPVPRPR